MGTRYAIIQYDEQDDKYYAVTSPKFDTRQPLTTLKGYTYFLQTDLLKVVPFEQSEMGTIYKRLVDYYQQSDIYFKTYPAGNVMVALALKKDTYSAMMQLQVKKAYSLPFLIVTHFEKVLKAPVVYYDGFTYIYFDGDIMKTFTLYDDFVTFVKPIVEQREVFYIHVILNGNKHRKKGSGEKLLIDDSNKDNLDFSYADITLKEITRIKLNYDVFEQDIQTEKINVPKSVISLIILSTLAVVLRISIIQPLATTLQPVIMPYKAVSDNLYVPSLDELALKQQNNISDFVYKKGKDYVLYVANVNGEEITFPTLSVFNKYKDELKIKYSKTIKFYKLQYKNNKLINKTEIP